MSEGRRLAVVVTTGDVGALERMARASSDVARSGAAVRVFFRDESIPAICRLEAAARLLPGTPAGERQHRERPSGDPTPPGPVEAMLQELTNSGDVRLYACSSSLYIWGVESSDLIPAISGARGLIAFLAEDLAGATEVVTY